MVLKEHIGKRLREKRLKHGKTLHEIADLVGVSFVQVSQVERGVTNPSVNLLWRLSRAFNVSPGYWFIGFKYED